MNTQKIYFFSNLRFLRNRRKLTQEQVSAALGIHRIKYTNLENGKTKSPNMDELLKLSRFYRLSIDTLLQIDLSKMGELKLRELENGDDVYIKGGNIRVLAITVDPRNNENVEYVTIKGRAGYAAGGFADTEFLAELPKYSNPNLPKFGTYRTFPIEGDSMLPFPVNVDITGRFIADWTQIKPKTLAIVVIKGQDIVFKEIQVLEDGLLECSSYNKVYKPFTVPFEEISEIWEYHSYATTVVPEMPSDLQIVLSRLEKIEEKIDSNNH
ncbi:LexA family transcriptional regulator [Sphingobacterium sp. UGAL515B_05]|uniref:XRE family transcriptional regulator n=1 Tax=Sphingobacterium sp. UGAL515B_05 TaxID=2986767 RepID=UPI002954C8E6|nr:LexA family transcriptional regulator [Sphingobacterium sp. UGAL515B_05]WON93794.1 LexA family transcriptional regulator [Sphingobacterium sp. UGAL515B_05]